MLEGLESIDWANLYHPNGTAEKLPEMLREMAREMTNKENPTQWRVVAEEILYLIDPDNVSVVSQVTPYIVPFWVQMLKLAEGIEYPHLLLNDISRMVSGDTIYDQYGDQLREKFEAWGLDYDEEIRLGPTYVQQVHDAASQHIDYFISFIDHSSPEFRKSAAYIVSKFPEYAARSIPLLLERYELEPNQDVRDELVKGIGRLTFSSKNLSETEHARCHAFFRQVVQADGHRAVGVRSAWTAGFGAARVLIEDLGSGAPEEAINVLAQAAIHCSEKDEWDLSLEIASKTLAKLGTEKGIPVFLKILTEGRSPGRYTYFYVLTPLIELAFIVDEDQEVIKPITQLTEQQRTIITAMISTEKIWHHDMKFLAWHGLPTTKEGLQNLVTSQKNLPT